jgi:hypothetical protein
MMALISNWGLKHESNTVYVYEEKQGDSDAPELHYAVSDLGAGFGPAGAV